MGEGHIVREGAWGGGILLACVEEEEWEEEDEEGGRGGGGVKPRFADILQPESGSKTLHTPRTAVIDVQKG